RASRRGPVPRVPSLVPSVSLPRQFRSPSLASGADRPVTKPAKTNWASRVNGAGAFSSIWIQRSGPNPRHIALSQPSRDARNRFTHFVDRARVGEADELTAVNRIEVDAGGCRDACLFQHLAGEFE